MTTDWSPFRLIPDDVLFFRDGRPSTRGEDHYLRSLFPPHPSTLYGAVRTRRLVDENVSLGELRRRKQSRWAELSDELRRELGPWGGFGELELRGPWLLRGDDVLVPAPADLGLVPEPTSEEGSDQGSRTSADDPSDEASPRVQKVARFLLAEDGGGGHSHPLGLLEPRERRDGKWHPWPTGAGRAPEPVAGWYLTPAGFTRWAEGGLPEPEDFVHASALWTPEPRVGLGMKEEQRTGQTGLLYTFGFIRLRRGVSLGFELRRSRLEPGRRIRLGGEGRTAWIEEGKTLPPSPAPAARRLRLTVATPALSESGAYPPGFSGDDPTGPIAGTAVRLLGASVHGHRPVGGWDLAANRAKPLRRAIPPGSVFVVEAPDGAPLDPSTFHCIHLSGYPEEHLARQGFGLVLAGADPQET